ncbi:MAG TPA: hypothetical protein VMJ66_16275 [Geobacteraceae bacterium]|nr:hypothetical protein [Geobacteraceae bacterium]
MNKLSASLLIVFLLAIISFGTWQLFLGNFDGAFATFPFLVIVYFFVMAQRR